ncbi:hypothetical protein [Gordonia hirsuta]|uniref:hypothetical protein n=1 Tax=Gordonia hirsuta TaxID=53427 RepID=UPI000462E204|nr:hypothetical protein [Gordonia hirsuta]
MANAAHLDTAYFEADFGDDAATTVGMLGFDPTSIRPEFGPVFRRWTEVGGILTDRFRRCIQPDGSEFIELVLWSGDFKRGFDRIRVCEVPAGSVDAAVVYDAISGRCDEDAAIFQAGAAEYIAANPGYDDAYDRWVQVQLVHPRILADLGHAAPESKWPPIGAPAAPHGESDAPADGRRREWRDVARGLGFPVIVVLPVLLMGGSLISILYGVGLYNEPDSHGPPTGMVAAGPVYAGGAVMILAIAAGMAVTGWWDRGRSGRHSGEVRATIHDRGFPGRPDLA